MNHTFLCLLTVDEAVDKRKLVSKWHPTTKGTLRRNYRVPSKSEGRRLLKAIMSLLSDDDHFVDATSHKVLNLITILELFIPPFPFHIMLVIHPVHSSHTQTVPFFAQLHDYSQRHHNVEVCDL